MTNTDGQLETQTASESLYSRLENGLAKHHFFRMTEENRFSHNKEIFECMCGAEFKEPEELRDHQALHLRIFLGIPEQKDQ